MSVHTTKSTIAGGVTPICNQCGVSLCWDIADEQYDAQKEFWDGWKCRDCNGGKPMVPPALDEDAPLILQKGSVQATIIRNAGHPWDNRLGFDQAHLVAVDGDDAALKRAIAQFGQRFWREWIVGMREDMDLPACVLWKPSGIKRDWDPSPGKN